MNVLLFFFGFFVRSRRVSKRKMNRGEAVCFLELIVNEAGWGKEFATSLSAEIVGKSGHVTGFQHSVCSSVIAMS